MMKMSEAKKVSVVFGEVGTADPVFHLSSTRSPASRATPQPLVLTQAGGFVLS